MEISLLQTALLCLLIFFAGFVNAVSGGGGLVSVPAYFALGLPPHLALGTNKFSAFVGTGWATIRYYRAGAIKLRGGLFATAGALLGSMAGAKIVLFVPPSSVNTVVLVVIPLVLALLLLKDRIMGPNNTNSDAPSRDGLRALALGFAVGGYDGFFGPGAAMFLAIGFHVGLRYDLLTSSANAKLANLASNTGALAVFLYNGQVLFPLALYAAAAGVAGNQLGTMLAIRKGDRVIKPLMVLVLLLLMAEVARRSVL